MFLSIFTDELGMDVTQAVPMLREWGLTHCDLRGLVFGKAIEMLDADELLRLRELLRAHDMRLGAIQSSLAKVHLPDAARVQAEKAKLEGIIRVAEMLDCPLVRAFNFWQPAEPEIGTLHVNPDQMQRVLDLFSPFARRAKEAGLVMSFENCGQTSGEVHALLDALGEPSWGLAWDPHNEWHSAPERQADEVDYLIKNLRRARMLHVKAAAILPELTDTPLPWPRILATAGAAGLKGPVSVETHNPQHSALSAVDASRLTVQAVRNAWPSAATGDIFSIARPASRENVARPYADDPVGFVVVGMGMGAGRARSITQTPGAHLVGVCDRDEERALRVADSLQVAHSTDLRFWLDDPRVEVVMVMTPTGMHAQIALQAIEAGKHVIVTKPMEATIEACDSMVRAAKEKGVLLAVDFERRFDDDLVSLKQAVDEGLLGRRLLADSALRVQRSDEYYAAGGAWRGTRRYDGGGTMSNQAVHEIDALIQLFGLPEKVRAFTYTQNHAIEAEDLGIGHWLYADGMVVNFSSTTTYPHDTWYSRLEFHGTQAAAMLALGGALEKPVRRWFSNGVWSDALPCAVKSPWLSSADNMAAAIRTHEPLVCSGEEGRKSRLILEAMYASAAQDGAWVPIVE